MIGSGWKMDPRQVTPQRVKGSGYAQSPLYTQWPRLNVIDPGDRGRQYKNTKSRCNREIQTPTRAVSGIAALVTTPLRSPVTRAPSDQASRAPGIRLSPGWLSLSCCGPSGAPTCPREPTGAAARGPALGTRACEARVAVAGKAYGLRGQPGSDSSRFCTAFSIS
jgi:hypothetical protein